MTCVAFDITSPGRFILVISDFVEAVVPVDGERPVDEALWYLGELQFCIELFYGHL
jgi:hypothetical protein